MTTKAELKILETIYGMEIERAVDKKEIYYQKDTKLTRKLVEDGLIEWVVSSEFTPLGKMIFKHLELTLLGNFTYCMLCSDEEKS